MSVDELKKIIEDAGIVGAGGGGFPTHLKVDSRADTILLNCAECEPLLTVHQQLLTKYVREILSALGKLSEVLDADVIVAVKKSYTDTISAVKDAAIAMGMQSVQSADVSTAMDSFPAPYENGFTFPNNPRIRLALLHETYPAGDEILLIHETTGKVVQPGTFPIESGCIVLNVETVYNIHNALEHGTAVTHKWLNVIGEVAQPATIRVALGTPISEAIAAAGGTTIKKPAYISGGPMMGSPVTPSDTITKTTNAIIVLPDDHYLIRRFGSNRTADLNRVASACCQCRTCTDLCPRNQIGYPIEPHKIMRALSARDTASNAFHGAMYCSMCGICEMVACPQSLAPRSLIKTFRKAMTEAGVRPQKCNASPISDVIAYRKVDVNRLKMRLGLAKY